MDQAPAARRPFWRFSLRELLLVMLAAGAFIGWGVLLYERSQKYEPSALFEHAPYWREHIQAAMQEVGQNPPTTQPLHFTVTQARGPSVHCMESYSIALAADKRDAFLSAFRQRVREQLNAIGCKTRGEAAGNSNGNHASIVAYRLDSRVGAVHVSAIDSADDHTQLIVSTHEEGSWRGDFGPGIVAGS